MIAPQPGGGLTHAAGHVNTSYGPASSSWQITNGDLVLTVEVPPNTSATVRLPGATRPSVTESGRPLAIADGVRASRQDGPDVVLEIGSGSYRFAYPYAGSTARDGARRPGLPPVREH